MTLEQMPLIVTARRPGVSRPSWRRRQSWWRQWRCSRPTFRRVTAGTSRSKTQYGISAESDWPASDPID